jgi:hypothetical protein
MPKMVKLAIRCLPYAPVAHEELERWLERHLGELRAAAPQATLRLSRLTQGGPSADIEIGWLVEVEQLDDAPLLGDEQLTNTLRDMRLLGIEPTVLAPAE